MLVQAILALTCLLPFATIVYQDGAQNGAQWKVAPEVELWVLGLAGRYLKTHQRLWVERRHGLIDPGPLREIDQEILVSLPASVSLDTRREVRTILLMAAEMAEHDGKLAAAIRQGLLAGLVSSRLLAQ